MICSVCLVWYIHGFLMWMTATCIGSQQSVAQSEGGKKVEDLSSRPSHLENLIQLCCMLLNVF